MAQTIAEQAGDVAALAKSQMEERKAARGTVKALGRDEEDLVLLARGCNQHYGPCALKSLAGTFTRP